MVKLWFNHWFSTARNIIELIRENNPSLYVIGTNENPYSVIKSVCDEWYQEPTLKGEKYVEFCLDFCNAHGIDVFIPKREMLKISEQRKNFEDIGVKVMVDSYQIVSVLNHKEAAYEYFKNNDIGLVPDYNIVTTLADFINAYEKLKSKYEQICFKFSMDEGGRSFRLIDNQRNGYLSLFKNQNMRITLDDVLYALSERETFDPIMIMPFLPDDEISVDCLETGQGLITLPRVKGRYNYETLSYDDDILELCKIFQSKAKLKCPYNIQFKYLNKVPYFLEVNTRMSGGIHMACHASGVNIPQIALNKLLGEESEWVDKRETKIIAQILQAITIK